MGSGMSREESKTKIKEMSKETTTTKRRAEEETIFKERESKPRTSRTPRQWNKDTTNSRKERMQTSST